MGANEKYRCDRRGRELWPEMFVPTKKLVVHHTATRNDCATADDAAAEVRAIYYYHAGTQRYGDVGYTGALIDKFGNVYEGRHGRGEGAGREILSAGVVVRDRILNAADPISGTGRYWSNGRINACRVVGGSWAYTPGA